MENFPLIDLESTVPATALGDLFHELHNAPLVSARTDSELASAFLYSKALSPHSLKSTRRDLGRFLLWCLQQHKMLMQLRIEDLIAYKGFLLDPQPAQQWISATKWPRGDPRWRPFSGPLSDVSANHAFRVVKALLEFAKDAGYLSRNAGALVKNIKTRHDARVTRYLDETAVLQIHAALDARTSQTQAGRKAQARDRFLFLAFVTTGARLSEITHATMGAIYVETDNRWWIDVLGKGNKMRRLPVSALLLDAYRTYRAQYGLLPSTTRDDNTPLVLATRGVALVGVTDEAVSKSIKGLFSAAAILAKASGNMDAAAALGSASAHWLRHTMLTTHANNDVPLKILQDTAGHANLSTTAMYLHKTDKERHDAILASLERNNVIDAE